jgi:RNA polymerase sigma-70 factor (ECF subfamily)
VRTLALDLRRSNSRRARREAVADIALPAGDTPIFDPSPEQKETADIVQDALRNLPEEQREVITLKLWGGLTFAEIATTTHSSINTVAGRYRYALNTLQKLLAPRRSELVFSEPPSPVILPFAPTAEALS